MPRQDAVGFIKSKGFNFTPTFTGALTRFDRKGKALSGWAVGKTYNCAGQPVQCLRFGDFATNEGDYKKKDGTRYYEWWSRAAKLTDEQKEALTKAEADEHAKYQAERKRDHELTKKKAQEIFDLCLPLEQAHVAPEYPVRKQLHDLYGARVNASGDVIVPRRDVDGVLWNFERISSDGTKRPLSLKQGERKIKGRVTGLFHTIGEISPEGTIYVCEGYATGASIWEALQEARALYLLQGGGQPEEAEIQEPVCSPAPGETPPQNGGLPAGRGDGRGKRTPLPAPHPRPDHGATRRGAPVYEPLPAGAARGDEAGKGRGRGEVRGAAEAGRGEHAQDQGRAGEDAPLRPRVGTVGVEEPGDLDEVFASRDKARNAQADQGDGAGDGLGDGAVGSDLGQPIETPNQHRAARRGPPSGRERPLQCGRPRNRDPLQPSAPTNPLEAPSARRPDLRADAQPRAGHHGSKTKVVYRQAAGSGPGRGDDLPGNLHRSPTTPGAAFGSAAVCIAFTAGNLEAVCKAIRAKYPHAAIVVAADDDRWTEPLPGQTLNPGLAAAHRAAQACGGVVRVPRFLPDALGSDGGPTDFNDMACLYGLKAVADALLSQRPAPGNCSPGSDGTGAGVSESLPGPTSYAPIGMHPGPRQFLDIPPDLVDQFSRELQDSIRNAEWQSGPEAQGSGFTANHDGQADPFASLVTVGPKGGPVEPSTAQIVSRMLEIYDGELVKQDKDLFRFTGTHWRHLKTHDLDELKQQLLRLCGGDASARAVEGLLESFRIHLPGTPEGVDLFTPNPTCSNFLNGTLHAYPTASGYALAFRPHAAGDYLANVLPYHYAPPEELPENPEFTSMLSRIFEGDHDEAEKVRAFKQMLGACLMPLFPHLFMLWGDPGTGKSTAIKIAARLVHSDNISRVDPAHFQGFNLETMAGKLVNMVTDIQMTRAIDDSTVKMIEDRLPFRIGRKYQRDLYAPLPAIHIFGGNRIPPTLDGASKAHDRRWTFLHFAKVATGNDRDYADRCFSSQPLGVLKAALEGLDDLVTGNGAFLNPASGRAKLDEWQRANDPVREFLEAVGYGEVLDGNTQLKTDSEAQIGRTKLYECFTRWFEISAPQARVMAAHRFYDELSGLGFGSKIVRGSRLVKGFCLAAGQAARF